MSALKWYLRIGSLRRALPLVLLLGGLIGCASDTPPPSPPSIAPAAEAAVEPSKPKPPVPKRKPPVPPSPQQNPPNSETSGDPEIAKLETPPQSDGVVSALPNDAAVPAPPSDVVGLESNVIEQIFGAPVTRRDAPPAVIWQYSSADCALDIWLYQDLQSGAVRALFAEVKGDDRTDQRRQYCIRQLAVDAAGRARRSHADAASSR